MGNSQIIVDIRFYGGSYERTIAYSIEFKNRDHWNLRVYDTREDVENNHPRIYWGVEKIRVIPYKED